MSLLTKALKQDAVYWGPAEDGYDDFGQPLRGAPVELKCRWEDTAEEFVDPEGRKLISIAKVLVGQDLVVGGVLMLGKKVDITDEVNPLLNINAKRIRQFVKIPTLKATAFLRIAFLVEDKL